MLSYAESKESVSGRVLNFQKSQQVTDSQQLVSKPSCGFSTIGIEDQGFRSAQRLTSEHRVTDLGRDRCQRTSLPILAREQH